MRSLSRPALLILLCATALPAHAGELAFEAYSAQGKSQRGPLAKLAPDWTVEVGGKSPFILPGRDLISLHRVGALAPPHPVTPHLFLAGGDRIPFDLAAGVRFVDSQFHVKPAPPLQTPDSALKIPGSAVALLWIEAPRGIEDAELFLRRLVTKARPADVVYLKSGDEVEGTLSALDSSDACTLKVGNKQVRIPFDRVAAVSFNALFLAVKKPDVPFARLVLADGCRLSLASAELGGKKPVLAGTTLFKSAVRVPVAELATLAIHQGKAVYLSDLKSVEFVHKPFLGVSWPLGSDAGAGGGPLRLGGAVFDKGLGMHTASRVSYGLGSKFRWLEALVGMDDCLGKQGSARVRVLVDDKEQDLGPQAGVLRHGQPVWIRIGVTGAKRLTLQCDFADRGGVAGHVNWADARLLTD
jgi:hypothetical protein